MKIAFLGGSSASTPVVYNYLSKHFKIESVIIEDKVSASQLLKRRVKKLGYAKVLGQILFQLVVVKLLGALSTKRIAAIMSGNNLNPAAIPNQIITRVPNVNNEVTIQLLKQLAPGIVIVNGTRIISQKVLDAVSASFINMHVGITPGYRGVHGAYWALVNNDRGNAGVTIHFVDKGIDTGSVIAQDTIEISREDNFVTYPYLQTAKGLKLMLEALTDLKEGKKIESFPKTTFSKLWTHPTIWEYFYYYFGKGVK